METVKTTNGKEFKQATAEEVLAHLKSVDRKNIVTTTSRLGLTNGGPGNQRELFLRVKNGDTRHYRVRKSFLYKLMRWYHLSENVFSKFRPETITAVGNDFLSHIRSSNVTVKTENDEALTIVSSRYSEFSDKELLEICMDKLSISGVSRDDFSMRIFTEEKIKTQPIRGDDCGFGYNVFNSETGFMALRAAHYILRYICKNGAVVRINGNRESIYHYNQTKEKILEYIHESISEIENSRNEVIKKLKGLSERAAMGELKAMKMRLGSIVGLTESTRMMEEFAGYARGEVTGTEYTDSMYSLFNFITHNAKGRTIMQQTQMEELAGSLLK